MAQDLFQYEKMVENALRGVVRDALRRVAQEGLRSNHHFYIAFNTTVPGVRIPEYLREKFPHEMTIVLQHQFWDLDIGDDSFSITLSFQKQLERLTVPFEAIRTFADPSVNFALEFTTPAASQAAQAATALPVPAPAAAAVPTTAEERQGAEVVALDAFRKR
jgi:hypothetical protein